MDLDWALIIQSRGAKVAQVPLENILSQWNLEISNSWTTELRRGLHWKIYIFFNYRVISFSKFIIKLSSVFTHLCALKAAWVDQESCTRDLSRTLCFPLSDHFSNPVLPEEPANPRLDTTSKGEKNASGTASHLPPHSQYVSWIVFLLLEGVKVLLNWNWRRLYTVSCSRENYTFTFLSFPFSHSAQLWSSFNISHSKVDLKKYF